MPPRDGPAPAAEARRPRLSRGLSRGVGGAYDYLGTVLAASVLWISLALLLALGSANLLWLAAQGRGGGALLLSLLGGGAATGIGTGPVTAGLFDHARRLLGHDDLPWWELPRAVARLWQRGLALAGLQVGVSLILVVDALFFLQQPAALLRSLGAAFLYPLLFWWGASLLQWPLAVERPSDSLGQVVKKSFLLVLDNLGYVSVVTGVALLLTSFCFLAPLGMFGRLVRPIGWVGLLFGWAGSLVFIQTAALRELLPKYGLLPPQSPEP